MEFDNSVAATWKGVELARSDDTVIDGDSRYFPCDSVNFDYLVESTHSSRCFWKGTAAYYDVVVDGQTNSNAAFHYPHPKKRAAMFSHRIAFGGDVEIS